MVLAEQGAEEAALPMHAVAEAVGSSPAALTGVVDRMEARGLVRRSTDPADRRSIRVTLAAAGEEALNEIDLFRRQRVLLLLDVMTDDEFEAVSAGLDALASAAQRASSAAAGGVAPLGAQGFWCHALRVAEAARRDRESGRVEP